MLTRCKNQRSLPVLRVISAFEPSLMYKKACDVAEKPHDAVVKFDTYRNLQWHRAVLPAIERLCSTNK